MNKSNVVLNEDCTLAPTRILFLLMGSYIFSISFDCLFQLTEFGFNIDVAKEALKRYGGVVEKAVEKLLSLGGVLASLPSSSSQTGASSSGTIEIDLVIMYNYDNMQLQTTSCLLIIRNNQTNHLEFRINEQMNQMMLPQTKL